MTRRSFIEYTDIRRIVGPLVVVGGTDHVGWDEGAEILIDGAEPRHGVVLERDRDIAVVEVFESTAGMTTARTAVRFSGHPLQVPVGEEWLGRVCNGRGAPIDGGPPVYGVAMADVNGTPVNPTSRVTPRDPILTGVSAIDLLTTLVRGQKLPLFSVGGLPHLELASQIAVQAHVAGEAFAVVFVGMGITHADAAAVRDALEERAASGELVLFINTADDPVFERIITPRVALTVAEHLAFETHRHVLVVLTDMTAYCEAVRQVSAARGELPSRRGYPGYLYSDLASIYERCGRIRDRPGSLTQVPVLTMPAGDITHPVPDLTGYITEGQIVLSAELHTAGIYPPIDPLASLSRLMRHGVGTGRTREDHLELAAQLVALLARGRDVRELTELLGEAALSQTDRSYARFTDQFNHDVLAQSDDESRSLGDTLAAAWSALSTLPRRELSMVSAGVLEAYYGSGSPEAAT